ncbi:MAG: ABC transporter permease [Veillonellaceae bacterium]|jgi:peptide/nickel transport system permease protein|nr:ABC transporter permease [Veillonellaceae bacterium]MDD6697100.1 ABC transporter permease [Veillonellaceae bacterium]
MLLKRFWKKLAEMLVTLLGVTFLTFCLSVLAPGDPAAMVLEAGDHIVSEELLAETRHEMGLDQPFLVQYGRWLGGVAHGDLGLSYSAKKPVAEKLMEGSTGTFFLAAVTVCFMLIISLPLGIWSAVHRNRWPDYLVRVGSFIGVSMPNFWLGLILLYVFGLKLGLFPITSSSVTAKGVVLPALTLAIYQSAKYVRQVRTVILDELHQDYVVGARARGISERRILYLHILPNALLPLITLLGMSIGWLLGGVAVIEVVFSWPGIGNMAVHAITMRDYPLVEGFVLWIAIVYMVINALVDLSYAYLDPRLRRTLGKGGGN